MTAPTHNAARPPLISRVPDFWAYIIPMAIFMAFTVAGGKWKQFFPLSYAAKSVLVAIALFVLWPKFTKIRWNHWWLGIIVGVVGVVQWVGMEKFLMSQDWLAWTRMGDVKKDAFNPYEQFTSPTMMWAFIGVRLMGSALVVPFMEELFWRDFLWRNIASPNDFKLLNVGEYDRGGFWLVPLFFATVHIQWLTAIVWGLMIGLLLLRTKSLGACIIAHGVTNFLLGLYVLYTHEWFFW